ncbi:hypothetical protein K3N28_12775 [Glycomyces sp. TRM65418]|uniref:hypothetical protein n=1 Tax=Glycomyces sp. TRM65418 TaxID=2867006 RepID=UPI001CE615E4|nr:hypothetical protein [Glycomyces sp. TRM65418]MCC3763939.1 hypothetical protein [Glycomyces sp. TRM65418]QZD53639.1 hypothetical protein K3N28_12705 [Glycomyces sp. TRM65418]
MRKGLIRRVAGRGRRGGPVRSGSGSLVTNASGKQYRVVAVNEAEAAEFADPPRRWGRVGMMAGGWALVLVLGASVAPGFAASGSEENQDPRDDSATDAEGAALRYLRFGSSEDIGRAESALCEDADPELTPVGLDAIRQSYADELGGITDVSVSTDEPIIGAEGAAYPGTVTYNSQGGRRFEYFTVTVQENDGTYCVSNAVHVQDEELSPGETGGTDPAVEPVGLVNDFLTVIVGNRDAEAATEMQCDSYSGITAQDLDAAVAEWANRNGWKSGIALGASEVESSESSITVLEAEIELTGDVSAETFAFQIGVQEDCIASLEGGEGLVE